MVVKIYKPNLCFVTVNQEEALRLIQSLTNQLVSKSPNGGRLESHCTGDVKEFTVVVHCT